MKSLVLLYAWGMVYLFATLLALFVAGCNNGNTTGPGQEPVEESTVLDLIQSNPSLQTLEDLIEGTSLVNRLSASGNVTIFAPGDAAFDRLPEGYLEGLTAEDLMDMLKYHLYSGSYAVINEIKREAITSLHGDPIFVEIGQSAGNVINGKAQFVSTNIKASNGTIHIIDMVLLPDAFGTIAENIEKRYDYRSFYNRLAAAELTDVLAEGGNRTLLAAPDLAIDALESQMNMTLTDEQWREIMRHHILGFDITGAGPSTKTALVTMSGDSVFLAVDEPNKYVLNNSDYTSEWIASTNGKVVFVAGVMLPDKYVDVLTLMGKRHNLKSVRAAFAIAKLTGTLYNTNSEFTIFAPKDDASGLNNWPHTEVELADILKYHVINTKLMADELQDGQTFTTWHGETITIQRNGDVITINGTAVITLADREARNGVVHVIDDTLTPPAN